MKFVATLQAIIFAKETGWNKVGIERGKIDVVMAK